MRSTMMSLISLALLVVVLSIQVQVQASPIPIPATVQERRGDKDPGVQAKSVAKRAALTEATTSTTTTTTTTGKQKSGAASKAHPQNCSDICTEQYEPYCAINSEGVKKEFFNPCQLDLYNCENLNNMYTDEKKGKCDSK
ncbi:hypothetical protein BGZ96_011892 [Linnemannia gamsii]|uniref:Kazal-like domain-containing protein n=1 Tax=Linnemannia gamsii TaxID=64522 RepID=A0ABQ7JRD5_9FUNG|nr:hypothetical protein BGZ96_011892 [Linnemannia gamsii]